MRLTFTIEFHRNEPEPEPWREVDMTPSQVELGPAAIGFAHPMHETGYQDRSQR